MATLLSTILANVRIQLHEPTARFWTDAEIVSHLNGGIADLWRAINGQYQDYYFTTTAAAASIASSATTVSGVPSDVAIVRGVEPANPAAYPDLQFQFKPYNDPKVATARAMTAQDPSQIGLIYLSLAGLAAPIAAPTIYVAPTLTAALALRISYIPTLGAKTVADPNPIPGEADKALEFWGIAYARAKLTEDQSPDPNWLALYATEKANILTALAPRQEQDDQYVEGLFESQW
jgi:hypothetical protein